MGWPSTSGPTSSSVGQSILAAHSAHVVRTAAYTGADKHCVSNVRLLQVFRLKERAVQAGGYQCLPSATASAAGSHSQTARAAGASRVASPS